MGSVISFFKSSSSRSSSTTRSDACYSDSDTDTDTDNGSSSVPNRMLSYGSKKSPTSGDHAAHAAVCQTECCHMLSYGSKFADIADNFTSLEQVQDALVKEGLESSNLILGINFTKSNEWTDTKSEKRIMHYSSSQKILLVGEGNFSFAYCLAKEFGSAQNMVATSLDSRESVLAKYSNAAPRNLKELKNMGCVILHEVNVDTMRRHHVLIDQLYDRIVFNFPHAGFVFMENQQKQIKLHQDLVRRFFTSSCEMLKESGEIHVTHKTSHPFSKWEIVKLAKEVGLYLIEEAPFSRGDYPGYLNKKGSGKKCNRTFRVGLCSTYKFGKLPLLEFSDNIMISCN